MHLSDDRFQMHANQLRYSEFLFNGDVQSISWKVLFRSSDRRFESFVIADADDVAEYGQARWKVIICIF